MSGQEHTVSELERELRQAQAELVSAARLATLGSLIAGIAHELNTPLGALHSNHDVLRRALNRLQDILADEKVDEEELAEVRRVVRALTDVMTVNDMAVGRMVQLVTSLRNFGRPDRSAVDVVDLHEGIDSTLAILNHQFKDRITVVRDYGELPRVECYANQLNQVWMNLLVNAGQAIQGTGQIVVRTRVEGDRARVQITDSGSGISAAHVARIFEPGFTTKDGRIGMGLGLLIVQQIVERHGGSIRAASEPGVGATFTVDLPLHLPKKTV